MGIKLLNLAFQSFIACFLLSTPVGLFAAEMEPDYVIFTILGPEATGSAVGEVEAAWRATLQKTVEKLRKEFGPQLPRQSRYIGYSVALVSTLNLKPDQLKAQVVLALDVAERNQIPVFFHLDDEHFWWRSPELWKNPEMNEWSDFPKPGEAFGPVIPRYWLFWGEPPGVFPAPPPCFACAAFRSALAERLNDVAKPIVQRLAAWKKQGKSYLFAGLAAGNETQVPDFRDAARADWQFGRAGDGMDRTRNPPIKEHMRPEDRVPIGYHSLHAMGYNQQSIARLAQEKGKSVEEVVAELFYRVAHDFAEFQTKTLNKEGISTNRLYTHFTSSSRSTVDEMRPPVSGRAGSGNLAPPVESAVNAYSRPGFTVVHDGVNLKALVAQLDKANAPEHGKAWAVVESYPTTAQPGRLQSEQEYTEYLGGLLAHGAKVVNIYHWVTGPEQDSPFAVHRSGALPAVKKWLAGANMPTAWSGSERQAQINVIRGKLEKLQKAAQESVRRGRDPHEVVKFFENFQKEFDPLIQAGKTTEAEALLERSIEKFQPQH